MFQISNGYFQMLEPVFLRIEIKGSLPLFLKFLWSLLPSSERSSEYDICLSVKSGQKKKKKRGRATQITELYFPLSIVKVCPKLKDLFFAFYFPVDLEIFYLKVLNVSSIIRIE